MENEEFLKNSFFCILPKEPPEKNIFYSKPRLEVIRNGVTDEDKTKALDFKSYHLIIDIDNEDKQFYHLGFCKKNLNGHLEYVMEPLDENTAFYRHLFQDPQLVSELEESLQPTDLDTLYYVEQAVRAAEGIVKPHHLMQMSFCENFKPTIESELVKNFLFYVALGEQERVEEILKCFPKLLLLESGSDVKSVSGELTFHNTTAFKLAVRNRDWHMYKMMLKCIPQDQLETFKANLHQQLEELEENTISYTLDNLSLYGLRVLKADELNSKFAETPIKEPSDDNPYHLILHRNEGGEIIQAKLGFRNLKNQYVAHDLLAVGGELKNFLLDANNAAFFQPEPGVSHKIIRDKAFLRLVEVKILQLGGKTKIKEEKTLKEHIQLLLDSYRTLADMLEISFQKATNNFSDDSDSDSDSNFDFLHKCFKHWCVVIGRWQRLCFSSPLLAQYLTSNIKNLNFKGAERPPNHLKCPLFPFKSSFADNEAFGLHGSSLQLISLPGSYDLISILENFLSQSEEEAKALHQTLSPDADTPRHAFGVP